MTDGVPTDPTSDDGTPEGRAPGEGAPADPLAPERLVEATGLLSAPWGEYELEEGEEREVELGPLRLALRRTGAEIWLSNTWSGEHSRVVQPAGTDETQWTRWAVPEGRNRILLTPVFPDRPVVVEPEVPFRLARGARVRIYVRVPLRMRVILQGASPVTLTEVPTLIFSDTWFGDAMVGEIAYALPTSARRSLAADLFQPHLAMCPLELGNDVVDQLEVKKICLRVAHLSLFSRGAELWGDETSIRYRGNAEGSDLRMSGEAPSEAPDALLVAHPLVHLHRGFRARTFARFAGLPGFGATP